MVGLEIDTLRVVRDVYSLIRIYTLEKKFL